MSEEKDDKEFINPIDPDKVAENPGLLPYAHHVGSAIVKPEDKGKLKGRAVAAMHEQTNMQINQLRKQMELLAEQARDIQKRVQVSEMIYGAQMNFEPLIGHTYYLYENKHEEHVLSMVAPNEWGRSKPYTYIATATLLADHTWEVREDEAAE